METVIPRLHASAPETLPFGRDLEIRAYLLQREQGNLLIYRSAALEREAEAVEELGGVRRQYLNHWHEAAPANDWVSERFGAPLHVHADDATEVSRSATVGDTFSERHRLGDDLEVIPTPGHTPGATAYLWDSGEHRALFTGDTLYLVDGEWRAAVLASSDRQRYIESLELIRGLDFDLLAPSIATADGPNHAFADRDEAKRRIDAVLERVRGGSDH
jgi:glyoxylase-like metal-dependent hydrolase (beta-lactamase superfamily II)